MALKITLTDYSREKLAQNVDSDWFRELMETLRNIAGSLEQGYSADRSISEIEHQALNGSYRRGAMTIVECVPMLVQPPKERAQSTPAPFGKLIPDNFDPKALPIQKNPTLK